MIKCTGHFVLVKVEEPEEVSKGGIVIIKDTREAEKRAAEIGVVVHIGPTAYEDPGLGGKPWCAVGDRVFFAKYSGKWVKEPGEDKPEFLMINDQDVMGVIVND